MKGIIMAGGEGTRLRPLTQVVPKQLFPVYSTPMIYFPLSVLMLAGIREILVITSPSHTHLYRGLLGDGRQLGLSIEYGEQPQANGIAEAFLLGADFIGRDPVALALGDNLFHGHGLTRLLRSRTAQVDGCVLFGYEVGDPGRFAVGEVDGDGRLVSIEEKPVSPRSNLAVTGLYLYDNDVVDMAKNIRPSARGELEITDVNKEYLRRGRAELVTLGPSYTWLDTGTYDTLMQAAKYVQALERRQGVRIACPEEIALAQGYITAQPSGAVRRARARDEGQ
ncbi:glucose-1-phosphate thymidylyltransferase RfbA [Streptomyces mutabilis]|uniref:glucose-1-phosphate thymidylyltransferase RfbA n=1 Tax=Streptomyces TaxID=1883 RepID=UPI000A2625B0|nr:MULTISPECIES: glucose-1-phosphate thymidylyltransferase RfbA [unclassified Streptomyces]MDG9694215.1 glucose-1-phosphate thymidylyltransferase RfbA [Streptomyces sp. DH17]OSC72196.1 glucose-1-phosphate thymidylyltransferase [Streptomyces sp. 4F]MDN3245203.1 glucose-1-phosphate thymidylyltransferase RfbA [Streptomyces sp. ZSW22]MDN3255276.1 glucose-1-phosphate thymidylyltransferase RfbA [Streptomyces sp. MA25(2023)]MDQ0384749.1 glucose-1-phosphate thymidylyltransferase [Streptomyces sp. DSM 